MFKIKIFKCGLCKSQEQYSGTRKGLRNHLKREHSIMEEITNMKNTNLTKSKQSWWIAEEII